MAGRYKGNTGSLTRAQRENMGCYGRGAVNAQVVSVPPPTYPPLATILIPIETCPTLEYKLEYKQNLINKMRKSFYHLKLKEKPSVNKRDNNVFRSNTVCAEVLHLIPTELHIVRKNLDHQLKARKYNDAMNIVRRLELLEKKDNLNDKIASNNSDTSSEAICEDDDFAQEIDDENDYENCYFDNGEAYNDEDDNMDDGPVY